MAQGRLDGTFHVYWNGTIEGGADGGGILNTQLRTGSASAGNTAGTLVGQYSNCVEQNQHISSGSNFDVAAYVLTSMSASEKATIGTWDDNGVLHYAKDANLGGIAYLVDTFETRYATTGTAAQADNLQHAIWSLWGFNVTVGSTKASDGYSAQDLIAQAVAHSSYTSNTVILAHNPVTGNGVAGGNYQDQVFHATSPLYPAGIAPEGGTMAMLCAGAIPVMFGLRRIRKRGAGSVR